MSGCIGMNGYCINTPVVCPWCLEHEVDDDIRQERHKIAAFLAGYEEVPSEVISLIITGHYQQSRDDK